MVAVLAPHVLWGRRVAALGSTLTNVTAAKWRLPRSLLHKGEKGEKNRNKVIKVLRSTATTLF